MRRVAAMVSTMRKPGGFGFGGATHCREGEGNELCASATGDELNPLLPGLLRYHTQEHKEKEALECV